MRIHAAQSIQGNQTNAHHETITSLKSAAALGCIICIAVLDELQRISDLDSDRHGYEEPFLKYHYFHPLVTMFQG